MPTYEYQCDGCGRRFELSQKMSAAPISVCEHCGGSLRRRISGVSGFIPKGARFYTNDYPGSVPDCGRDKPCCGKEIPCEKKPCG